MSSISSCPVLSLILLFVILSRHDTWRILLSHLWCAASSLFLFATVIGVVKLVLNIPITVAEKMLLKCISISLFSWLESNFQWIYCSLWRKCISTLYVMTEPKWFWIKSESGIITEFIHSGYFYVASSSPLLLRGTPDHSTNTVLELTCQSTTGNCEWRTCPRTLHGG